MRRRRHWSHGDLPDPSEPLVADAAAAQSTMGHARGRSGGGVKKECGLSDAAATARHEAAREDNG
jgi:hypothetical protein